jgi:MraZ protein
LEIALLKPGFMFNGEYIHQLDEKARFKLPKKLQDTFLNELGVQCVLMKMPESCLAIYPAKFWKEEFQAILSNAGPSMPGTSDYRALTRIIGSSSLEINIGAQGRVALPDAFRKYIGVEAGENVVVVGAGTRVEIWSESLWSEVNEAEMASYNDIVERIATAQVVDNTARDGEEN